MAFHQSCTLICAGHEETEKTAKQGKPIARMLKMAQGMLEAVQNFKMPQGTLRIRVGELRAAATWPLKRQHAV